MWHSAMLQGRKLKVEGWISLILAATSDLMYLSTLALMLSSDMLLVTKGLLLTACIVSHRHLKLSTGNAR